MMSRSWCRFKRGRQAGVLALLPDGQAELVLGDDDLGRLVAALYTMREILAGDRALARYTCGSSSQRTMAIFSPRISSTMACTRVPLTPHAGADGVPRGRPRSSARRTMVRAPGLAGHGLDLLTTPS
jgi:hypothetical protein